MKFDRRLTDEIYTSDTVKLGQEAQTLFGRKQAPDELLNSSLEDKKGAD